MRSRYYGGWAPYVPVAQRRANATKKLDKLRKKGLKVQPVEIDGRKIAASFWGKGWCDHMESFSDYDNRLPRGRTYIRNGSVCHLDIQLGRVEAIVSGSELYNIAITIAPLAKRKWDSVKTSCAGQIGSLIDLLRGKLAGGVMEIVSNRETGLFPLPGEMKFTCDCPDSARMCKHIAAVLYGVGARLDQQPELLFELRNVDPAELIAQAADFAVNRKAASRKTLADDVLGDVFGIELKGLPSQPPTQLQPAKPRSRKVGPASARKRVRRVKSKR